MGLFESIADRRIREARRAGLFDDLAGAGQPIADLGTERAPGWWAARVVKTERDIEHHRLLSADLRAAMVRLWRLDSRQQVLDQVVVMNGWIDDYNRCTSFEPIEPLHGESLADRWSTLR